VDTTYFSVFKPIMDIAVIMAFHKYDSYKGYHGQMRIPAIKTIRDNSEITIIKAMTDNTGIIAIETTTDSTGSRVVMASIDTMDIKVVNALPAIMDTKDSMPLGHEDITI
jgi:hypothetical protein